MTDRAFLESTAARYLHRTDFTQDDLDTAIRAATIHFGHELRCMANLEMVDATSTDPYELPERLREIQSAEFDGNGGPISLQGVSRQYMNRYPKSGGSPAFYIVLGRSLYLRPYQEVTVRIWYWSEPEAIAAAPTSTNAVLTAYPLTYLYRMLAELCFLTQDPELARGYLDLWQGDVDRINGSARMLELGDSPAMRGV